MSDLDNEEYEATKKLSEKAHKITWDEDLIIYPTNKKEEKNADEMFEDENYIKEFYDKMGDLTTSENCEVLVYRYYASEEEIETQIEFYLEDEEVGINGLLNKRVLQAINKKCKELGWLE